MWEAVPVSYRKHRRREHREVGWRGCDGEDVYCDVTVHWEVDRDGPPEVSNARDSVDDDSAGSCSLQAINRKWDSRSLPTKPRAVIGATFTPTGVR